METAIKKLSLNKEKAKLKQKFASLIDDDLLLEEGRQEELSMKYQAIFFQSEEVLLPEEGRQEKLSMKYQAIFFQSEEEWDKIISSPDDLLL